MNSCRSKNIGHSWTFCHPLRTWWRCWTRMNLMLGVVVSHYIVPSAKFECSEVCVIICTLVLPSSTYLYTINKSMTQKYVQKYKLKPCLKALEMAWNWLNSIESLVLFLRNWLKVLEFNWNTLKVLEFNWMTLNGTRSICTYLKSTSP